MSPIGNGVAVVVVACPEPAADVVVAASFLSLEHAARPRASRAAAATKRRVGWAEE